MPQYFILSTHPLTMGRVLAIAETLPQADAICSGFRNATVLPPAKEADMTNRDSPDENGPVFPGKGRAVAAAALRGPGRRIRMLRQTKGWSQAELALRIDTSPNTVSRHELGQLAVDKYFMRKYADVLGVTTKRLRSGRMDPEPTTQEIAPMSATDAVLGMVTPFKLPDDQDHLMRSIENTAMRLAEHAEAVRRGTQFRDLADVAAPVLAYISLCIEHKMLTADELAQAVKEAMPGARTGLPPIQGSDD